MVAGISLACKVKEGFWCCLGMPSYVRKWASVEKAGSPNIPPFIEFYYSQEQKHITAPYVYSEELENLIKTLILWQNDASMHEIMTFLARTPGTQKIV